MYWYGGLTINGQLKLYHQKKKKESRAEIKNTLMKGGGEKSNIQLLLGRQGLNEDVLS